MLLRTLILFMLCGALVACSDKSADAPDAAFAGTGEDQLVVVNYWAEWCKPCRQEIPALNEFARRHGPGVVVYGVNFDGASGEELRRQEQALGVAFDTLPADPGPQLDWPLPEGLPQTVFTDSSGSSTLVLAGEQTVDSLEEGLTRFRRQLEEMNSGNSEGS